jgi:hypothetical protein
MIGHESRKKSSIVCTQLEMLSPIVLVAGSGGLLAGSGFALFGDANECRASERLALHTFVVETQRRTRSAAAEFG